MDYYKILGLEKGATEAEIKKAYRKLAQKHHPDTAKGDGKKFKEIAEAYEVLSDPQKRSQYDQFGRVGGSGGGGGFGGFGDFGGFDFSHFQNANVDFGGGFGDIFDSFFGGGASRSRKRGPQPGANIEMVLQVSFEESIAGSTREIEVSRYETCSTCAGKGAAPGSKINDCQQCSGTGQQVRIQRTPLGQIQTSSVCSACQGEGKIPEEKCKACQGEGRILKSMSFQAKIPAGIHDRAILRLSGKGEAGTQGGPYGDLFLHISVSPSRQFKRVKDDIHSHQSIHLLQAVLGDEIPVQTVHGQTTLKIPAGTESGKTFRIREQGAPKVGSSERGDHHVTVTVEIPKKISAKEKKLYQELAKEADLSIQPQSRGLFG